MSSKPEAAVSRRRL